MENTKDRFGKIAKRDHALAVIFCWWELDDDILKEISPGGWQRVLETVATMRGYEKVGASIEERFCAINNDKPLAFWLDAVYHFKPKSKLGQYACEKIKNSHTSKEDRFQILRTEGLPYDVRESAFNVLLAEVETFEEWCILFGHIRETTDLETATAIFEIMTSLAETADDWFEILNIVWYHTLLYTKKQRQTICTYALDQALALATTFDQLTRLFDYVLPSEHRTRVLTAKMECVNGIPTSKWYRLLEKTKWPSPGKTWSDLYSLVAKRFEESDDELWALVGLVKSLADSQLGMVRTILKKILKHQECLWQPAYMFQLLRRPEVDDLKQRFIHLWDSQNLSCETLLSMLADQCVGSPFAQILEDRLFSRGSQLSAEQVIKLVKHDRGTIRALELLEASLPKLSFSECYELFQVMPGHNSRRPLAMEMIKKASTFGELYALLNNRFGVPDDVREVILAIMAMYVSTDRLD